MVARISGCADQTALSLDDQVAHAKQVVVDMYDGPVEYRVISTIGKGEALDRPELQQIEAELCKGELDLLVMEDLGRLVRGAEATRLLGVAVDHDVRAIVVNDGIDTDDEAWEQAALRAAGEHVGHNAHTSRRIKQKSMNRFKGFGGAPARPIAGYDVPAGSKKYGDRVRQADATAVIAEGLRRLKETPNCEAVAEYFNAVAWRDGVGFPTGPYCRRTRWDGKMVRRFYLNRTLGGAPGRGFKHSVKRHGRGRRVSVPNPLGPTFIDCPNLAHVDLAELDAVNATVALAHAKLGRKYVNGADPLAGVSRKDSHFPRGPARCWYCGRQSVWGGNGVTGSLMCTGARDWRCWASIAFSGAKATDRVIAEIFKFLDALDGFDAQFRERVAAAMAAPADLDQRRAKLKRDADALAVKERNVQATMAAVGPVPLVLQLLAELKSEADRLAGERRELERLAGRTLELPESIGELRTLAEAAVRTLARGSREFDQVLRKLVPEFDVYLVRLFDGGHPLPRARVRLALDRLVPDAEHVPALGAALSRVVTIDLFDPPQREAYRERAVALAAAGAEQREVAGKLKITQTAVSKALGMDLKMREAGLASPYVMVDAPPADYPKLRRHLNGKYKFEPLEGYVPPPL